MGPNALRWDGSPGHYEVHYLSLTDRGSGCGLWIRYTMVAPLAGAPSCALWFMAMDPAAPDANVGRKASRPIAELRARAEPFELRIGEAVLTDGGAQGAFDDVAWDLEWAPGRAYEHVHPLLRRARVAKTVLALPGADLAISGKVRWGGRELELRGARGGQAHLWGSKHAARWAWVHCNDLEGDDGSPRADAFLDGVSVFVPRLGREVGPSTPVVARVGGRDLRSTGPLRVVRNPSIFSLTSWAFQAAAGDRRLVCEVDARREDLVGVTYRDPDGEHAYCYNTEVADLRVSVWEGGAPVDRLVAPRRAHFEYAQREPVPDLPLHVR